MLAASAAAAEQQQQQEQQYQQQLKKQRRTEGQSTMQLANETTTGGCSATCMLEPPPDMILRLPPPPLPGFLAHTSSNYYTTRTSDGHLHSDGTDDHHPGTADHHGHSEDNEDVSLLEHFRPCKYSCSGEWRITDEGLHHVEIPQQGSIFEDTWLVILISASVGVIFIGIILATLMIRCKLNQNVDQTNDGASQCSNRSNKNSTLSTSTASSSIQTTTTTSGSGLGCSSSGASTMGISGTYIINNKSIVRLQNEAILYPCSDAAAAAAAFHDSRVMWATLTPRGTTRHYLEDHTYETIGGSEGHLPPPPPPPPPLPTYAEVSGYMQHHHQQALPALTQHRRTYSRCDSPNEHVNLKAIPTIYLSYHSPDTYHDPPAPSPSIVTRPKDDREKAFDNTAFVDYEDPLSLKNEYYQLEDVMMEPSCDQIFSVQGLYGLPPSTGGTGGTGIGASSTGVGGVGMVGAQHHQQRSTLVRPRVSTPTRIEHPNLPPLNQRSISKRAAGKNQQHQQQQQLQQHTLGRSGSSTSSGSNSTNTTTSSYVPTI